MQRGVLQLTREEVVALNSAFHWVVNGHTILASKLQYAMDNLQDIHSIEVSEEDLELLLDDIMPVEQENTVLVTAMKKVAELLREFRR